MSTVDVQRLRGIADTVRQIAQFYHANSIAARYFRVVREGAKFIREAETLGAFQGDSVYGRIGKKLRHPSCHSEELVPTPAGDVRLWKLTVWYAVVDMLAPQLVDERSRSIVKDAKGQEVMLVDTSEEEAAIVAEAIEAGADRLEASARANEQSGLHTDSPTFPGEQAKPAAGEGDPLASEEEGGGNGGDSTGDAIVGQETEPPPAVILKAPEPHQRQPQRKAVADQADESALNKETTPKPSQDVPANDDERTHQDGTPNSVPEQPTDGGGEHAFHEALERLTACKGDMKVAKIASDENKSVDQRLREICDDRREYWFCTSVDFAKMLGCSDPAVRQTKFWKEDLPQLREMEKKHAAGAKSEQENDIRQETD